MNWASKHYKMPLRPRDVKLQTWEKPNTLTYTISLAMKEMHSKNCVCVCLCLCVLCLCVCVCVSLCVVCVYVCVCPLLWSERDKYYIQEGLEHFSNNTYKEMEPIS